MPKIDTSQAPLSKGSRYPKPYDEPCLRRTNMRLGEAAGLTKFGVNITILLPGAWSSQRHWHAMEDEFVYVLEGELVLIEDEGEVTLKPGDCAAWKAGVRNGHHLVNRSEREARFLVVGSRDPKDWGDYPDIDLQFHREGSAEHPGAGYTHKDGRSY